MPVLINGVPFNPAAPAVITAAPAYAGPIGPGTGYNIQAGLSDAPTLVNVRNSAAKDYTSAFPQQTGASTGPRNIANTGGLTTGMNQDDANTIVNRLLGRVQNSGLQLDENTQRIIDDIQDAQDDPTDTNVESQPALIKELISAVSEYEQPGVEAVLDGAGADLGDLEAFGWADVSDYAATDDTTDLSGVGDGSYDDTDEED